MSGGTRDDSAVIWTGKALTSMTEPISECAPAAHVATRCRDSSRESRCNGTMSDASDFRNDVVPRHAGSGDKQSKAKFCRVEIDKIAVAFGPPT